MSNSNIEEVIPKELQDVRDRCVSFLLEEAKDDKNWKVLKKQQGKEDLSVWQYQGSKWKNNDIICVRGRLRFPNTKPEEILAMIRKLEERHRWDHAMEYGEVKKTYKMEDGCNNTDCGCDIAHLVYNGVPLLVSSRDLCLFRYWETTTTTNNNKRIILACQSVVNDAVPTTNNCVRADLMECGYLMEEGVDHTDVTYISSLDFRGEMPSQLVNMSLKLQPNTLLTMRRLLGNTNEKVKKGCVLM